MLNLSGMYDEHPKISQTRRPIRQLDAAAANRIAAGEVVERPASAVKELVENALDAGARRIDVAYADGGKRLIRVQDDGHGIPADELRAGAASGMPPRSSTAADLTHILTFGFRGEALPSLGAVGRLTLTSRAAGAAEAASLHRARRRRLGAPRPAALARGTMVEIEGLFSATPARLKFLRSRPGRGAGDRRGGAAAGDDGAGRGLLADRPLRSGGAARASCGSTRRPGDLFDGLGAAAAGADRGRSSSPTRWRSTPSATGCTLGGFAALPTFSRGAAVAQHLFVNGRPVRDKLLLGALRAAYSDLLPRDRHPVAVLFLTCDPEEVDVNVHPAKAEVRFRDPGLVRGLVVGALRQALAGGRAPRREHHRRRDARGVPPGRRPAPLRAGLGRRIAPAPGFAEPLVERRLVGAGSRRPLPASRARPRRTCRSAWRGRSCTRPTSIAQTADGMVIVDQHAAHERLVYERLKAARAAAAVPSQMLLIPEVVDARRGGLRAAARGGGGAGAARAGARAVRRPGDLPARDAGAARRGRRRAAAGRRRRRAGRRTRAGGSRRGSTRSCPAWPATARCGRGGRCAPRR